eukprot:TRINITY_DN7996_c0_g1_i2.p1 TRINITY_DN7996_c0_g1~~TRINITY_DN7996_c0_g1_i2.p1  ORF type:complete len:346 (+),score=55.70 TRINITY_DN7996_c0_g1_i2:65-1102(+)
MCIRDRYMGILMGLCMQKNRKDGASNEENLASGRLPMQKVSLSPSNGQQTHEVQQSAQAAGRDREEPAVKAQSNTNPEVEIVTSQKASLNPINGQQPYHVQQSPQAAGRDREEPVVRAQPNVNPRETVNGNGLVGMSESQRQNLEELRKTHLLGVCLTMHHPREVTGVNLLLRDPSALAGVSELAMVFTDLQVPQILLDECAKLLSLLQNQLISIKLNLNHSNAETETVVALMKFLPDCVGVETLTVNLRSSEVDDQFMLQLAATLKKLNALKRLNFSIVRNERITPEGFGYLKKALVGKGPNFLLDLHCDTNLGVERNFEGIGFSFKLNNRTLQTSLNSPPRMT